jgi:hypothetical protein
MGEVRMGGMNRHRTVPLPVFALVVAVVVGVLALPAVSAAATITGTVLNEEDPGAPLGGVGVIVWRRLAVGFEEVTRTAGLTPTSGPDAGIYRLEGVPEGSYVLNYWPKRYSATLGDGYRYYSDQFSGVHSKLALVSVSDEVTVGAEPTATVPAVHLQPSPTFVFRVRRFSADGPPVPSAGIVGFFRDENGTISEHAFVMTPSGDQTTTNKPSGEWRFSIDPNPWWSEARLYAIDSTATSSWPTDGTSYIDVAGGATATMTLLVSRLPLATPVPDAAYWQQGDVTVAVSQEDGDYTPTTWHLRVTRNDWVSPPVVSETTTTGALGPIVFSAEGSHQIEAWGVDDLGRKGPTTECFVGIDRTPPHTTANVDTLSHAELVLDEPTDGGSGWRSMHYTLNGSEPQTYTLGVPVPVPPGLSSVTWWSVDSCDNVEPAHSGTIINGPQPYVRKPVGRSSVRVRRSLTFSGKMTRAANHRRLTLLAYRFDGVDWVLMRTKTVVTHTPRRRGLTTYRGSIKFTAKGRWKVVARYEGDGYWMPAWSPAKYVTVK